MIYYCISGVSVKIMNDLLKNISAPNGEESADNMLEELRLAIETNDKKKSKEIIESLAEKVGSKSSLARQLGVAYHDVNRWTDERLKNMPGTNEIPRFAEVVKELSFSSSDQKPIYPISIGVFTWPQIFARYDKDPNVHEVFIFSASEFLEVNPENTIAMIHHIEQRKVRYCFVFPKDSPGHKSFKSIMRACQKHQGKPFAGEIIGFEVGTHGSFTMFNLYARMRAVLFLQEDEMAGFLSIPVEPRETNYLTSTSMDTMYDYVWKQVSNGIAVSWRTDVCETLLESLDEYDKNKQIENTNGVTPIRVLPTHKNAINA
jgi:hypothetical protein